MAHNRLPSWSQLPVCIDEQVAILFRQEEAGGQGIYADAWTVLLRHVHRQPLGEIGYRCLGRAIGGYAGQGAQRSEEHTSELQSLTNLVCRLLLEKKKKTEKRKKQTT